MIKIDTNIVPHLETFKYIVRVWMKKNDGFYVKMTNNIMVGRERERDMSNFL